MLSDEDAMYSPRIFFVSKKEWEDYEASCPPQFRYNWEREGYPRGYNPYTKSIDFYLEFRGSKVFRKDEVIEK